ncbi:deoxycytidylate deaminase-like [Symsagittifera roscoffensis]|uniref:deoxycytidylate deaminase-like n=1 Tax=Symsagittifera roscoffensis TaxID=84072 RepID=UPI00307C48D0
MSDNILASELNSVSLKENESNGGLPWVGFKRNDYLSWDEYFMSVALLSAQRSKDPNRQVGACVVNSDNKIVSVGYNGFPVGCDDDDFPWGKKGGFLDTKYAYVCHAEMNAVVNRNTTQVKDCRIYVTLFPCNECTKLLIQSGIKEVIFGTDSYHDEKQFIASRKMLTSAGVNERKFVPLRKSITIDFEFDKS